MKKLKSILQNDTLRLTIIVSLVNGGNYLLNLLLGRYLGPEVYAEVGVLATMVLVFSFLGIAVQMTIARTISAGEEDGSSNSLRKLYSLLNKAAIILTILLIGCTQTMSEFLQFRSEAPIYILVIALPIYLNLSAHRGCLQGERKFSAFGRTFVLEMLARLLLTIALLALCILYEVEHYSIAVSVGFLFSFVLPIPLRYWRKLRLSGSTLAKGDLASLRFFGFILLYELSQVLISYGDVLLVKHYFSESSAGQYTALSMIGRMVFFASWSVVMVMLPKVAASAKRGEDTRKGLLQSISIVAGMGGMVVLVSALFPEQIIMMMFGQEYLEISNYLWKYALGTTLFALSNVFAYYYLALGKIQVVLLPVLLGCIQILLLAFYHNNLNQIIEVQIACMLSLGTMLTAYHTIKSKKKNEISYRIAISTK